MQLLCPECCSEEVGPHPDPGTAALRCVNCGAGFDRDDALVTVAEAEESIPAPVPAALFTFDRAAGERALLDPAGALFSVSIHSDADELDVLVDAARESGAILTDHDGACISIYPLSIAEPDPLVAVWPAIGPAILGGEPRCRPAEGQGPVGFTLRLLEGIVAEANGLAAGRAADSERLDRIAAFLNRPGQWNGGDVCEFLAEEIVASGRRLAED